LNYSPSNTLFNLAENNRKRKLNQHLLSFISLPGLFFHPESG